MAVDRWGDTVLHSVVRRNNLNLAMFYGEKGIAN